MARNNRLRQLAVAATFLFHHSQHALALPQAGITVSAAPPAWVTVDPSGVASTVTPAVITTEGQRATVLEPPASLLSTATYTLSPNGHASTYTGLAPVASATGDSDAGAFLACTTNQGVNEPFCLPKSGSTLHPGHTYYITWSPSYFSPPTLLVELQAFSPSTNTGFTSARIPASTGFYAWTIPPDFLSSSLTSPYPITFLLSYDDPSTPSTPNDRLNRTGPTVFITTAPASTDPEPDGDGGGAKAVAIAVPAAIVLVLLLLLTVCCISYRRHGTLPLLRTLRRTSQLSGGGAAAGYGGQEGRAERSVSGGRWAGASAAVRVGGGGGDDKSEMDVGIQLTDRDSWSPTGRSAAAGGGGRNVFREEVERQARLG